VPAHLGVRRKRLLVRLARRWCQVRGASLQAAYWYRQDIGFIRAHPHVYSAKGEVRYQRRISRLDHRVIFGSFCRTQGAVSLPGI
jgi:hypothetical protein